MGHFKSRCLLYLKVAGFKLNCIRSYIQPADVEALCCRESKFVPCSTIGTIKVNFMQYFFLVNDDAFSCHVTTNMPKHIVLLGKGKKMLFYSFIIIVINLFLMINGNCERLPTIYVVSL